VAAGVVLFGYDAMHDGIPDRLRLRSQLEFVQDSPPICAHRLGAESEFERDLFHRLAERRVLEDIELSVRERFMWGTLGVVGDRGDERGGDARGDVAVLRALDRVRVGAVIQQFSATIL
jgi:hypothetical protein